VLAQIPRVIEARRLKLSAGRGNLGEGGFRQNLLGEVLTAQSAISWMKLMLLYSPEAMRETTSRRVISGSTMASRPRRP